MIQACGLTNVGRVRKNNEDAWIADQRRGIFLVADGIGGHSGGEIASSLAVQTAYRELSQQDIVTPAERLRGAFRAANHEVQRVASIDRRLAGMGTTLVGMMLTPGDAWIGHTGDSRCYLLRKQSLMRLTNDHAHHGGALMHAIGLDDPTFLTTKVLSTHSGDVFLLCSDGLTNAIPELEIAFELRKRKPIETLCRNLVKSALEAGGSDNVTVIVVRV
jgi:protein phosphatase